MQGRKPKLGTGILLRAIVSASALSVIVFALAASTAAATTTVSRTTVNGVKTLTIVGDPGEEHDISLGVDYDTGRYEVFDDSATLSGAQACSYDSSEVRVHCDGTPTVSIVRVTTGSMDDSVLIDLDAGETTVISTGGGDDFVKGVEAHDQIDGGSEDDVIDGSDGNDTISGGAGDDVLDGSSGDDALMGGADHDALTGDTGTDFLSGGLGSDTVDYAANKTGVTVDLDGNADDGVPGEHDNVRPDIENIQGGYGPDVLTGSDDENILNGGDGNDTISSRDAVADRVACGKGADSVSADNVDEVEDKCEQVERVNGPSAGGFRLVIKGCEGKAAKKARTVCARISCPGASGKCTGKATFETASRVGKKSFASKKRKKRKKKRGPKPLKLGSASFEASSSKAANVTIKLSKAGQRMLKRKRKLSVRATVEARDSAGNKESDIGSLNVTAPKSSKKRR
jgi:Ca2+-binding RTX toxin-like protein